MIILKILKAQMEAVSISLAMNQTRCGASSSVPTLPPASIASGSSNAAPPVVSPQLVLAVAANAPSKSITLAVCIYSFFALTPHFPSFNSILCE